MEGWGEKILVIHVWSFLTGQALKGEDITQEAIEYTEHQTVLKDL